ncbi:MAG: RNA methyltransferase, partial [Kibdelosporangium sp.]
VLAVPFTTAESWPGALEFLREKGFQVLALTPRADSVPLNEVRVDGPVAVLLGSEGPGLTDLAIDAADQAVRIPMSGGVDSLNVATAGAVAFYALGTG